MRVPQGVRVCGSPRSCKSEPNPQTGSDNGGKGFMPPPRFPSRLRLARNLEHPRRSKSDVFWIRFFWCLLGSILGPLPPKKPQDRQKRSQDRTPRPPQEAPRTFRPKRQPRLPKTVRNGPKPPNRARCEMLYRGGRRSIWNVSRTFPQIFRTLRGNFSII